MGSDFSQPVPVTSGQYVCMVIRAPCYFRVVGAPQEVIDAVIRVAKDTGGQGVGGKSKLGCYQLKLPGRPFMLMAGKDTSTLGKLFAARVLEEMHLLGYDFVCSSDLSRLNDHSSWFFAKSQREAERSRLRVVCVAPGSTDKIILVKGDEVIKGIVREAIEESWTKGIQSQSDLDNKHGLIHEFKMRGRPFFQTGEQSAMCRRMLLTIIGQMGARRWRLLAATSLKGGTDTLFFIEDSNYHVTPRELAMISLNRNDRLRLINFDESAKAVVRAAITKRYQEKNPQERDYHEAYEFTLKGWPFHCSGEDAVASRRLVCQVLQDLSAAGWYCMNTIDVSRRLTDKSVFLFRRSQPLPEAKFACVALTSRNHLRVIDFPPPVRDALVEALARGYMPGVSRKEAKEELCHKVGLSGPAWVRQTGYSLHARVGLMSILDEAAKHGWYLKASADVSAKYVHQENGPDYPLDVHSWFFCHFDSEAEQLKGWGV